MISVPRLVAYVLTYHGQEPRTRQASMHSRSRSAARTSVSLKLSVACKPPIGKLSIAAHSSCRNPRPACRNTCACSYICHHYSHPQWHFDPAIRRPTTCTPQLLPAWAFELASSSRVCIPSLRSMLTAAGHNSHAVVGVARSPPHCSASSPPCQMTVAAMVFVGLVREKQGGELHHAMLFRKILNNPRRKKKVYKSEIL